MSRNNVPLVLPIAIRWERAPLRWLRAVAWLKKEKAESAKYATVAALSMKRDSAPLVLLVPRLLKAATWEFNLAHAALALKSHLLPTKQSIASRVPWAIFLAMWECPALHAAKI